MLSMKAATSILTEHVSIIEWPDDTLGVLAHHASFGHADIKYGAKLNVRDYQQALFMDESQFADVYNPGIYTLTRESMPRMSVFKHWNDHHDGSFNASVFFIKTKFFIDQPWALRKSGKAGFPNIHGSFDIKIINARKIVQKMMQDEIENYAAQDARHLLENVIARLLPDALKQSNIKSEDELDNNNEVAAFIQESINIEMNDYGLLIRNLTVRIGEDKPKN